uniref:Transmembrane protein 231 n=1 Tax=Cacopsylla melanoneura TaxID=428564 RepID=A0A8D8QQN8_9HEMI
MVYNVFSIPVVYKYKAHFWSEATALHFFLLGLNIVLPIVFLHETRDMWKKFDVYRETPSIEFKYQYLVIFESRNSNSFICDSFDSKHYCQEFQVHESDTDRDDRYDSLTIKISTVLPVNEPIYAVHVFLPVEFKVTTVCWFQMEGLIMTSYFSFHPGSSLQVFADLQLHQKTPLPCTERDLTYNASLLNANSKNELPKLFADYNSRNAITRLINEQTIWMKTTHNTNNTGFTTFTIDLHLRYPEQEIIYKTTFWQMIKWFLVQYLPVVGILFVICKRVRKFVFTNNVISTVQMIHSSKY